MPSRPRRARARSRSSPIASAAAIAASRPSVGLREVAGLEQRPRRARPRPRCRAGSSGGEQVDRAAQQAGGRGQVATRERAPAGRAELVGRARGDRPALGVERPELAPVAIGLLEVVAEDLLELLLPAALLVDPLGPGHEPLVELGAGPLQQRPVGRVADEQVAEAVGLVLADDPRLPEEELLAVERVQVGRDRRPEAASGTSSSTAGSANTRPITAAGSTTARSSRVSASRRAASSAWIVGGTASSARSPVEDQPRRPCAACPGRPASTPAAATNSGLPSAERRRPGPGRPRPPRRPGAHRRAAPSRRPASGPSARRTLPSRSPHSARFSSSDEARRRDDQDRRLAGGHVEEVLEQVEERRLGVVDVVDDDDDRPVRRERLEELAHAPEHLGDGVRSAADRPIDRRQAVEDLARALDARRAASRACRRASSGVSSGAISAALRAISTTGQKVMPSPYGRQRPRSTRAPPPDLAQERVDEARLADARLAEQRDDPAAAAPDGLAQAVPELGRAPARGRRAARRRSARRTPSVGVAHVDQPVGGDALGLALELERLDRLDLDLRADEAVGRPRR